MPKAPREGKQRPQLDRKDYEFIVAIVLNDFKSIADFRRGISNSMPPIA